MLSVAQCVFRQLLESKDSIEEDDVECKQGFVTVGRGDWQ